MTLLETRRYFESIPETRWTVENYQSGRKKSALGWHGVREMGDHRYKELFEFRRHFTANIGASISEIEEASLASVQKLGYNPKTPKRNVIQAIDYLISKGLK